MIERIGLILLFNGLGHARQARAAARLSVAFVAWSRLVC